MDEHENSGKKYATLKRESLSECDIVEVFDQMDCTAYIPMEWALKQHDTVLRESGGLAGVLNPGQLESALELIKDNQYYPSSPEKISHLMYSIIMGHVFCDANKRTSIAVGAYFMELNGFEDQVGAFMVEMEDVVVMVAEHCLTKEQLTEIIAGLLYEVEYSPSTQEILRSYRNGRKD